MRRTAKRTGMNLSLAQLIYAWFKLEGAAMPFAAKPADYNAFFERHGYEKITAAIADFDGKRYVSNGYPAEMYPKAN